ncbi:hypothetical protein GCM10023238_01180 [Streptomyces heliomycini]
MQEAPLGVPGVAHGERDQAGGERGEDPAARAALGEPGARDGRQRAGRDDPVEGGARGYPARAVAGDDDRTVPGGV